ncbi:MAG: AMMECR1 family protein [Candidatus Peribacteria bacterium]|nr:AMMECR1 family protein [Candidatus Peribacteria bacterium]
MKENSVLELIENTISAISKDPRFSPLSMNEAPETKIRVDKIISRDVLRNKTINDLDPTTSGVITIKKDYSKIACILPNINPKLFVGADLIPVLEEKLKEKKLILEDYIIYEIKTEVETNY